MLDVTEAPAYPWCTPENLDALTAQLSELPTRLPVFPMLVQTEPEEGEIAHTLTEEFPCPTCPSRPACHKDHAVAFRLRQDIHRHTKMIQALRTGLWHRFQAAREALQQFGYLTAVVPVDRYG